MEVAGEEFDAASLFVELTADAVVFFLEPDGRSEAGGDGFGGGLGAREHKLERVENAERDAGEGVAAGGADDGGEVAAEHAGFADGFERAAGGGGDGFFDEAFFEADAKIGGDDLDEVFRGGGGEAGEAGLEEVELGGGAACGGEGGEEGGGFGEGEGLGRGAAGEQGFGGVAAVAVAQIRLLEVGGGEAGDFEDSAAEEGPADVEGARIGLGEGAAGEEDGGVGGIFVGVERSEVVAEEGDFFQFGRGRLYAVGDCGELGEVVDGRFT